MIVAGIDIGSMSGKAVLLDSERIISWSLIPTGPDSTETAFQAMGEALNQAGLSLEDMEYIVSTGYGRVNVPFAHKSITEISCHAKGTHWLFPQVRTILDMGGQDCKAIRCDGNGKVTDFVMNDKCAAGTGRYLERLASICEVPLEEIGTSSLQPVDGAVAINSYCIVFAEVDIIMLLRQGKHVNDILAGAHEAITRRIQSLIKRVGVEGGFAISGGVAKNMGVVRRLEEIFELKAEIASEPQIVGALGAALFARERLAKARAAPEAERLRA